MPTKMTLLPMMMLMTMMMMLLQMTIVLETDAAAVVITSTVDPSRSSESTYTTEGLNNDNQVVEEVEERHERVEEKEEDRGAAAAAAEKHEDDEQQDAGRGSHDEHHSQHWDYHGGYGPKRWSSMFEGCAGRYQSPINIDVESTRLNELLSEISLVTRNVTGDRITIKNNGHTVNFAYGQTTMRLNGGGYEHTYRVAGVHFHWGSDDLEGSEHMIHGKHFPLEMHVVCYDEDDYDSVSEATTSRDGIAVLGILFTVSNEDNIYLDPVISHLIDVRGSGEPVLLEYFDLEKLLPLNRKNYFRYSGSLTTPPCSESVVWTVFETTQTISSTQLAEFRTLYEVGNENGTENHLLHNWRPVQPTLKRLVYRSFPAAAVMSGSHLNPGNHIEDQQQLTYNVATAVVWNTFSHRNYLFIACLTFFTFATILL